jgi:hypothetical protein
MIALFAIELSRRHVGGTFTARWCALGIRRPWMHSIFGIPTRHVRKTIEMLLLGSEYLQRQGMCAGGASQLMCVCFYLTKDPRLILHHLACKDVERQIVEDRKLQWESTLPSIAMVRQDRQADTVRKSPLLVPDLADRGVQRLVVRHDPGARMPHIIRERELFEDKQLPQDGNQLLLVHDLYLLDAATFLSTFVSYQRRRNDACMEQHALQSACQPKRSFRGYFRVASDV